MKIAVLDLKKQYETIKEQVEKAVLEVFSSQGFVMGPLVERFEQHMVEYSRCRYAVGVSSGTDALLCSLMALGIGVGDEVIVPTFTFFGTAGAVWRAGAQVVFVDIEPATFNIEVAAIEGAITDRTRAIIPVHLFGQMAAMEQIMALAQKYELAVIEDACQSIGSERDGAGPGQLSDCACLSFYPSKNLGGAGDGGMILCQEELLARKCRALRVHGEDQRYYHSLVGGNFRLDALQAAVLDVKLQYLAQWTAARRAHAAQYDQELGTCVQKPVIAPGNVSVYNQYVIRAEQRDELKGYLVEKGVGSMIYYPVPLHLQKCFAPLGHSEGDFPVSEQACREVLALPIYPEMTAQEVNYVARCVREFYGAR